MDMQHVVVKKDDLLAKVKENKEKHVNEAKIALDDYNLVAKNLLLERIELANKGEADVDLRFNLAKPVSYQNEYERAIEMLEMTTHDKVTLSVQQFDQYVRDRWGWKESFSATNSIASGMAINYKGR